MARSKNCAIRVSEQTGVTLDRANEILDIIELEASRVEEATGLWPDNLRKVAQEKAQGDLVKKQQARERLALEMVGNEKFLRRIAFQAKAFKRKYVDESALFLNDLVGATRQLRGGYNSTGAQRTYYEAQLSGPINEYLKANPHVRGLIAPRKGWLNAEGRALTSDIVEELYALHPVFEDITKIVDGKEVFSRRVVSEFHPMVTKNKDARALAEILHNSSAKARQMLVDQGANIGMIRSVGYAVQSHDKPALMAAGLGKWTGFIHSRLNKEATFWYLRDGTVDPKELVGKNLDIIGATKDDLDGWSDTKIMVEAERLSLSEYYRRIVHSLERGDKEFTLGYRTEHFGRRGVQFEHSRELIFQGGKESAAYQADFGSGNILTATTNMLDKQARELAHMDRYGPRPEKNFEMWRSQRLAQLSHMIDAETNPKIKKKMLREQKRLGNSNFLEQRGYLGRAWAEVVGATLHAESTKWARAFAIARKWANMVKLGSSAISATADVPLAALRLTAQGQSLPQAWSNTFGAVFKRIPKDERLALGHYLDSFADGYFGNVSNRFSGDDTAPGKIHWMESIAFKLNGLEAWTDNLRSGLTRATMTHAGSNSKIKWKDLGQKGAAGDRKRQAQFKQNLELHGITDKTWDALVGMGRDFEGKTFLVPEDARLLTDEKIDAFLVDDIANYRRRLGLDEEKLLPEDRAALEAEFEQNLENMRRRGRDTLEAEYGRYISAEVGLGVLVPTDRTRLYMFHGTRPGTLWGEAARSVMQFKSFSIGYMHQVFMPLLRGSGPDMSFGQWFKEKNPFSAGSNNLFAHMAFTTMFGYMAFSAKRLTRGQEPPDPRSGQALVASFIQGGGAGIMGDFLLGQYSTYGRSLGGALAGPTLGAAGEAGQIAVDIRDVIFGAKQGGALGAKSFRWLQRHGLPLVNLFYTRAGFDYMFLYHMEEMFNPGILRRRERRQKQLGIKHLVPPSTVVARGGGFK